MKHVTHADSKSSFFVVWSDEVEIELEQRYPVDGYDGWWRIENPRRYITPFGNTISNARFHKLRNAYGENIPESEYRPEDYDNAQSQIAAINAMTATPVKDVPQEDESDGTPNKDALAPTSTTDYTPGFKSTARPKPQATVEDSIKKSYEAVDSNNTSSTPKLPTLPDPVLSTTRASGIKASSKELAAAFKMQFIIITSIAAMITEVPELELSEGEAMAIAIPAANLLEKSELNKRFGRMIAGAGDWSLLGYAVFLYIQRVGKAIMLHAAMKRNSLPVPQPMPVQTHQVPQPQYRTGFATPPAASVRGGAMNPNVAEATSDVIQASNGALVARPMMPMRGVTRTFQGEGV